VDASPGVVVVEGHGRPVAVIGLRLYVEKKNWGVPKQELNSKSVSSTRLVRLLSGLVWVEFPVTIKVWQNDTVQVSTKNSETPLDFEGFNLFLYYLEGIFGEAFESDLTPLYVERFHYHQDRYDLKYKGGLVSVQVFRNLWLTVYTKESMQGEPVRFEAGIIAKEPREIGIEDVRTLLSTGQRDLQTVNLLEKFSKQPKQCTETRKATTRMYQDVWKISSALNQKVKALEGFKQELLEEKITLIMRGEQEPVLKEIEKLKKAFGWHEAERILRELEQAKLKERELEQAKLKERELEQVETEIVDPSVIEGRFQRKREVPADWSPGKVTEYKGE